MNNGLPQGWAEIDLRECVDVLDNQRVPVNSDERAKRQGDVPYYGATGQVGWIDEALFNEELLLIGEDGAPFLDKSKPISYIIRGKSWVNNHAHVLRARLDVSSNQYLKHFLDSFDFHEFVNGTTRLKLTQGAMNRIPVRVAPLGEQRRIVGKLEKLLDKVDASQQRLVKIPVLFKRFRQSVLAAACSGRLTADWREENPDAGSGGGFLREVQPVRRKLWEQTQFRKLAVSDRVPRDENWKRRYQAPALGSVTDRNELPQTWIWERLDAVLAYIEAGKSFTCEERPPRVEEVGVLKVSAVTWGEFDEQESKTCKEQRRINPDIQVKVGDFLFSRANTIELVGAAVIVKRISSKLMLSDKTLRLQIAGAPPEFVLYALRTPAGRTEIKNLATGNQNSMRNIGQERIRDIVIPFPPLAEQQEIVRRVERLFALADQIEARYAKAKAYVEKLTQSILAKAFRGELVPQDPKDEPASVLLERMRKKWDGNKNSNYAKTKTKTDSSRYRRSPPR